MTRRIRYRGFSIRARPYQLHDSKTWTADLEISRHGRAQPFGLGERFETAEEVEARCSGLGRQIIDGRVPGWSVDHLRGRSPVRRAIKTLLPNGEFMRQFLIAGILIFGLGALAFFRGGTFTSRPDLLKAGDQTIAADQPPTIPSWVGVAAMTLGLVVIVAGGRKRA